jgi:pimeloyl-ACP methyl ester carboxylesterase
LNRIQIPVGEDVFDASVAGPEDGEVVLLLHGFPQTSWSWRHQLQALGDAGYRAVAPDQRGYSPGARPEEVERYAIPALVGDVIAIADELGAHRFHLVGHDWGAAVAWQVAGRHPDRL